MGEDRRYKLKKSVGVRVGVLLVRRGLSGLLVSYMCVCVYCAPSSPFVGGGGVHLS